MDVLPDIHCTGWIAMGTLGAPCGLPYAVPFLQFRALVAQMAAEGRPFYVNYRRRRKRTTACGGKKAGTTPVVAGSPTCNRLYF